MLVSSCFFSNNRAPSKDLAPAFVNSVSLPNGHRVSSGETLYSIAWRYGLDYRALAELNQIDNRFLIYVGQTLKLRAQVKPRVTNVREDKNVGSKSVALGKKTVVAPTKSSKKVIKINTTPSVGALRSEKKSSRHQEITTSNFSNKSLHWFWPVDGKVLTNFSSANGPDKGIDIQGKKGDSVKAAAMGQVVYAGSGLRGYGKLIIIKHNNSYLSAYAHNDRIHIREGQNVKAGQHIADIGSSGSRTESVKLHFEIRRNGQPVDPLALLPKKRT